MGWSKWVLDRLEKTRGKPERPQHGRVEGLHGEAANHAWSSIVASSLMTENITPLMSDGHFITLLDEIDKRSPKR